MAYLMTDAAAGSNAAMTMMENMGGASLAQDVGQAKAEKVIADTQKAKLSNLVAESGFKAGEESRAKLKELQLTPDFQAAIAEQDHGKALRMMGATQMLASDVEKGAATLAAAEVMDAKKIANQQKQLDLGAQQIGNTFAVLDALKTPEQQENFFKEMQTQKPKEYETLVNAVGPETFNKMSSEEKRGALRGLMFNAKGQLAVQLQQGELQKKEMEMLYRERIAAAHDATRLAFRMGGSDRSEMLSWKNFQDKRNSLIKNDSPELKKLNEAVEAAEAAQEKSKIGLLFNSDTPTAATEAAYKSAIAKRDEFKRNQVKKEINLTLEAPDFAGKKIVLENLKNSMMLLGGSSDEEEGGTDISNKGKGGESTGKGTPAPAKEAPAKTSVRPADAPADAKQAPDGFWYSKNQQTGKFIRYGDNVAAPVSEEAPPPKEDTTKYARTKGGRGNWVYTPSGRGLTRAQYAEIDKNKKE